MKKNKQTKLNNLPPTTYLSRSSAESRWYRDKLQANKGFTLIEILIVVVIAVMVFIVMYAFYANTIKFDTESRYEIIASNLAQEGIELCRNGRDNEILQEDNLDDFDNKDDCESIFGSDVNSVGPDFSGIFTRSCTVSQVETEEKYEVECEVEWDSFVLKDGGERSVTAEAILTNWAKE